MDIHLTGLICHLFEILSKIFIKDRILSENRTIYNWNIVKCLANDGRKEKEGKRMRKESKEMAVTAATMKKRKGTNLLQLLLLITWRAGTRTNVFRIQPAAVRLLTTTG